MWSVIPITRASSITTLAFRSAVPDLEPAQYPLMVERYRHHYLSRDHELALFAGASGDHNPIHIDIDFARKAGMPDVFAHGMLSMAWLGRLLTAP